MYQWCMVGRQNVCTNLWWSAVFSTLRTTAQESREIVPGVYLAFLEFLLKRDLQIRVVQVIVFTTR